MKRDVLIVDDDARIRASLAEALSRSDTTVRTAADAASALRSLAESPADIVLADVRMPGMDGLELLRLLRERAPQVAVVLMTAYDDLPTVATAMREGAADFLVKPLDLHQLRGVINKVFDDRAARAVATRAPAPDVAERSYELIGHDPRMVGIFKTIGQVSATRANVVIRGESGTGKELIARAIHSNSPHAREPFVPVNCTALPATLLESELFGHVKGSFTGAAGDRRGRFALAGKGTIFLDEIGDTSLEFQGKLLRVLQEHEYYPVGAETSQRTEARVIAATHRDLEALVGGGEFREDLYYRLRVVEIVVPPLRDRISDLPPLAEHLVRKASRAVGRESPLLAPETVETLLAHSWPGNVRELENCLTRAVVLARGDVIRPEDLALGPRGPAAHRLTTLEEAEKEHVAHVLEATHGHKSRTAEILGISRPRLDRLIQKYGLGGLTRTGERAARDAE
ncbi:MAG: sigma-54-dependent Fis family transcriptional regulator [Gemmatimonadetes bacterium]|nr:sigma-54-dependent Fis family transcriptional regulator [Gemmatimonadota bacterium]